LLYYNDLDRIPGDRGVFVEDNQEGGKMEDAHKSTSQVNTRRSHKESRDTEASVNRVAIMIYCIIAGFVFMSGCLAPFSEMQSAKLVGKGKTEITPMFSVVHFMNNGETTHLQNEYGIQQAYGVSDKLDLRLRYVFVHADYYDPYYGNFDLNVHVIGFGPKIGLYKQMHALYLPIGFAFGEDIDITDIWQFHPTFLFTFPVGNEVELNPSMKILVPIAGDADVLIAFNLGAGLSADIEKWAIRPEIGFLVNPGEDGCGRHLSIGLTLYP
jgi:hypothetical protein